MVRGCRGELQQGEDGVEAMQSWKGDAPPKMEVSPDRALPSRWQQQCLTLGEKLGELCLLTDVPFKPLGRSQDINSQARKHLIEKPKLQTALNTNTQVPTELLWGLGSFFYLSPPSELDTVPINLLFCLYFLVFSG